MMWLGIVIMVLGFIGTLVFAKMRQQPPAAGCAVLMIVGLGIYMWFYLNPPPDRSGEYYAMAVAAKIAKLPEVANAKVWIASDIAGEYSKNIQEAYKAAGGKAEWKSASSPESGMMDEKVFAEMKARDERDSNRSSAPLKPAEGAHIIDTSTYKLEDSLAVILPLIDGLQ